MISIEPEAFVNIVFNINCPETDEDFRALGTHAGNRYKAIPLAIAEFLKANIPETLMHVELHPNYGIIWDTADWELASMGQEKRMLARAESRARMNAGIEEMAMLETWCESLAKDNAKRPYSFWISKLSALRERDGILKVRELVETMGECYHGEKGYFYGTNKKQHD